MEGSQEVSREERVRAHAKTREAGAAERVAKHDQHFADQYLDAGGERPVSAALLKTMGYSDDELSLAREEDDPPKGQAA